MKLYRREKKEKNDKEREKWKNIILVSFIETVEKCSERSGMSMRASFVYMWSLYEIFCENIFKTKEINKDITSSSIIQAKKILSEEFKEYIV